jgi:hypothetical protein
MSATRKLSSDLTPLCQIGLPVLVVVWGFVAVVESRAGYGEQFIVLVGPCIFTLLLYLAVKDLVRVEVDETGITLSRWRQSQRVPFGEVLAVGWTGCRRLNLGEIEFSSPTRFGETVRFIPIMETRSSLDPFMFMQEPPAITELRGMVWRKARERGDPLRCARCGAAMRSGQSVCRSCGWCYGTTPEPGQTAEETEGEETNQAEEERNG